MGVLRTSGDGGSWSGTTTTTSYIVSPITTGVTSGSVLTFVTTNAAASAMSVSGVVEAKKAAPLGSYSIQAYAKGQYAVYVRVPTEVKATGWKYYAGLDTEKGKTAVGKQIAATPDLLDALSAKAKTTIKAQLPNYSAWHAEVQGLAAKEKSVPAPVPEVEPASPVPVKGALPPEDVFKEIQTQFAGSVEDLLKDPDLSAELAKTYGANWAEKYKAGQPPVAPAVPAKPPVQSVSSDFVSTAISNIDAGSPALGVSGGGVVVSAKPPEPPPTVEPPASTPIPVPEGTPKYRGKQVAWWLENQVLTAGWEQPENFSPEEYAGSLKSLKDLYPAVVGQAKAKFGDSWESDLLAFAADAHAKKTEVPSQKELSPDELAAQYGLAVVTDKQVLSKLLDATTDSESPLYVKFPATLDTLAANAKLTEVGTKLYGAEWEGLAHAIVNIQQAWGKIYPGSKAAGFPKGSTYLYSPAELVNLTSLLTPGVYALPPRVQDYLDTHYGYNWQDAYAKHHPNMVDVARLVARFYADKGPEAASVLLPYETATWIKDTLGDDWTHHVSIATNTWLTPAALEAQVPKVATDLQAHIAKNILADPQVQAASIPILGKKSGSPETYIRSVIGRLFPKADYLRNQLGPAWMAKVQFALEYKFNEAESTPATSPESSAPTVGSTPGPISTQPALNLPDPATLTYQGPAVIGGAGKKSFYVAPDGKKYLFKPAVTKGTGAAKPFAAAAQAISSQVALAVRPDHIPVAEVTLGGEHGTIQPWMGDGLATLKGVAPSSLSDQDKLDVAMEHVADWATSNHDTHAANFIRLPSGRLVSVDKEQAFRFMMPGSGGPDELSTDYAPNTKLHNEEEPYYNKFWKAWVNGSMDFDPQKMLPAIEAIEKMDTDAYLKAIKAYQLVLPDDHPNQVFGFQSSVRTRLKGVRLAFEHFLTKLYRKKKKVSVGYFSFAGGWTGGGAVPAAPPVTATPPDPTTTKAPAGSYGGYPAPAPVVMPQATHGYLSSKVTLVGTLTVDPTVDVAALGGAKEKKILKDEDGTQYLFKPTKDKVRALAGHVASQVAAILEPPGEFVPVLATDLKDFGYGSIQPLVPNVGTLEGKDVKTLSAQQLRTLQRERVLDWLLGNHDTKPKNFIVTSTGGVLGVDKERAFKPFSAATTTGSKLSDDVLNTSYAPTGTPPIYNAMYAAYAAKQLELNPMDTLPYIEQVEKVSEATYKKLVTPYLNAVSEELGWGDAKKKVVLSAILERKKNLRADFEKFFTSLRAARGEADPFKFPAPGSVPFVTASATGVVPPAPIPQKKAPEPVFVPEGYPPPPPGKKYKAVTSAEYMADGFFIKKTKPFKGKDGQPDPSSPLMVVKFPSSKTHPDIDGFFKHIGITPEGPYKTGATSIVAIVKKATWAATKTSGGAASYVLEDIPPPPPPPVTFTPYEIPVRTQATATSKDINAMATAKDIHWGKQINAGGTTVEGQTITVKRYATPEGKSYYQLIFKVREGTQMPGGTEGVTGGWNQAEYHAGTDSFVGNATSYMDTGPGKQWKDADGQSSLFRFTDSYHYAYKNYVIARVYPKEGEPLLDAARRVLSMAGEPFAKKVLKPVTEEDRKIYALSRLFWSAAPQASDALSEKDRTVETLTKKLAELGYTQDQLDSIRFEEVSPGYATALLPGRAEALRKKHGLRYVFIGVGNPDKVALQIAGTAAGVVQRNINGVPKAGASYDADVNRGSADSVFARVMTDAYMQSYNSQSPSVSGQIQIIVHPSELDRLDAYMYNEDTYGRCRPENVEWKNRKSVETLMSGHLGSNQEILFRRGIRTDSIVKIMCHNEDLRNKVIQSLKKAGMADIRGVSVEEFVVVSKGGGGKTDHKQFYEEHLKASGY